MKTSQEVCFHSEGQCSSFGWAHVQGKEESEFEWITESSISSRPSTYPPLQFPFSDFFFLFKQSFISPMFPPFSLPSLLNFIPSSIFLVYFHSFSPGSDFPFPCTFAQPKWATPPLWMKNSGYTLIIGLKCNKNFRWM